MEYALASVNPTTTTYWVLAYYAVKDGLNGIDGVSVFGGVVVGAMKDVLDQGMYFVRTTIKHVRDSLTTSKLLEVSCVLKMALLLVEEGTMKETLPSKPCALCRAFARALLFMFDNLCCFVDALLVATTADKNLAEAVKMLVIDLMLVLGWVVEDADFAAQQAAIQRKYKTSLIDVVLRLLNKPSMALAAHASSILEVVKLDFCSTHFKLLRKYLEGPAQSGDGAQELRESVVEIVQTLE